MMASTTAFNATNHGLQIGNNTGSITAEFHVARAYTTEDIDRICLHALRCPNSLAVKNRLKESKDRLVHQSIQWILEDPQYKDWENGDEVGLLWIKGGAGKGKTMLSIGLIEELARAQDESTVVIYSFCQNADYELNTLEAIVKGLIFQLANQKPELKESLRRRWDTIQESFSEDVTSWQSLWNILFEMLSRCKCSRVYMVIDALDECRDDDVVDFLKSIVRKGLDHPGRIKWLLTSRPWDGAERMLLAGQDQVQINLDAEYNSDSVSGAVEAYITSKVEELSRQHRYGAILKSEIMTELTERSEGTFLWVSLVCKALESVSKDKALSTVQSLPPGLHPFYERVLSQLNEGDSVEVQKCMRLLKAMMTVYRPLKVKEIPSVIGLTDDEDTIRALVDCCASFIRLQEDSIEFVHQSARDYLAGESGLSILDSHGRFGHEEIALACLSYLSEFLECNLVGLPLPNSTRDSLEHLQNEENGPKNDILTRMDYVALFWVLHLKDAGNDSDKSQVSIFLHTKLLEWLECLSLMERLPKAIEALRALENILNDDSATLALVQDAMRFLLRHYHTISHWPLQIYSSAVIFSPESSVVKKENLHGVPVELANIPPMEDSWSPLIQTLRGHTDWVGMVAFSPDGKQIASGSDDGTIKLWDAITGSLQQTLSGSKASTMKTWDVIAGYIADTLKEDILGRSEGYSTGKPEEISAMAFLPDSKLIISGTDSGAIILWDTTTGDRQMIADHFGPTETHYSHLQPPEKGNRRPTAKVFSGDCKQIASIKRYHDDQYIMLFDTATGNLQKMITGYSVRFHALAYSPDNKQLVSGSEDNEVRLWDTTTGDLQKTLVGHKSRVCAVSFSPDGKQIVSGSKRDIIFWNAATGDLKSKIAAFGTQSVAFSRDSKRVAAGFFDGTVRIWDDAGNHLKTLACHPEPVESLAFSPDGKQIITGSTDTTVRRWDITIRAARNTVGHSDYVSSVAFSSDGRLIASGSAADATTKLWDAATGNLQRVLACNSSQVVFSPDNKQIASCSDEAVKLWDAATGDLQSSLENDIAFSAVAFSPDGKQIVSGHENGNINLWDPATGNLQKALAGHTSKFEAVTGIPLFSMEVTALAFSPDSKLIASISGNETVKLWDAVTGDLQKTLECRTQSIMAEVKAAIAMDDSETGTITVAFSPDSQQIAALCDHKTIKVWKIKKLLKASKYLGRAVGSHIKSSRPWKEIQTPEPVYKIEFAADNRYLETDIGPIVLESTASEGDEKLLVKSNSLQNLYVREGWLCYGAMPILRLLPDFHVSAWDTHGDKVAIGFTNGQFVFFNLYRQDIESLWEKFQAERKKRDSSAEIGGEGGSNEAS